MSCPKRAFFPEIDLRPNNEVVRVFQVDTTAQHCSAFRYLSRYEEIKLLDLPKHGVFYAQLNILLDQGAIDLGLGECFTKRFRTLRLYRRGYKMVEIRCGGARNPWDPVGDLASMERTLDKIWSCDEVDWQDCVQSGCSNPIQVAQPARNFLASEYEFLADSLESASEHPTTDQQNQIQRLWQKANWLRQSKAD